VSLAVDSCACAVCRKDMPPTDRLPWGEGAAHFACAVRQALNMTRRGRVLMLARRRMANDNGRLAERGAR